MCWNYRLRSWTHQKNVDQVRSAVLFLLLDDQTVEVEASLRIKLRGDACLLLLINKVSWCDFWETGLASEVASCVRSCAAFLSFHLCFAAVALFTVRLWVNTEFTRQQAVTKSWSDKETEGKHTPPSTRGIKPHHDFRIVKAMSLFYLFHLFHGINNCISRLCLMSVLMSFSY